MRMRADFRARCLRYAASRRDAAHARSVLLDAVCRHV